ncbi:MAG: hypothetical protein HY051_01450 [Candidatus Aenigmarchaeota archaeon]|nr:hypothetical protein [Candidatus Aenigmarchaeota archaeon]
MISYRTRLKTIGTLETDDYDGILYAQWGLMRTQNEWMGNDYPRWRKARITKAVGKPIMPFYFEDPGRDAIITPVTGEIIKVQRNEIA